MENVVKYEKRAAANFLPYNESQKREMELT